MKVASGAGVLTVRVSTQFWRELPSAESSRPSYRGSHNARPCLALTCKHQFVSAPRWRRLKQAGTEIPVVFMTAIEDEALEREAVAAGCIAYLRKPFRAEPLLTASSARSHSPRATSIAWLASSRLPQRTIERLADSLLFALSTTRAPERARTSRISRASPQGSTRSAHCATSLPATYGWSAPTMRSSSCSAVGSRHSCGTSQT